jgi:hypothetical protein
MSTIEKQTKDKVDFHLEKAAKALKDIVTQEFMETKLPIVDYTNEWSSGDIYINVKFSFTDMKHEAFTEMEDEEL